MNQSRPQPQIPGNSPADVYNRAYFASVSDAVLSLWNGMFGFPGRAVFGKERKVLAAKLQASGEKITHADLTGVGPYDSMAAYVAGGYKKASLLGETPEDWETMRPGDHDPTGSIPDYNGATHTGVVSLDPATLKPYGGLSAPSVDYVGDHFGNQRYNVINGGELKDGKPRPAGDTIVKLNMLYSFVPAQGASLAYWQLEGKAS